ncbi:phosphotransferase [Microbacterium telephonicum]|uniref:Aminoglycoside phosphotransferase (APT) family kinase protein n=1 Tax=Microbacterium telephonicum TaxID=1714841 RepID=A0A498BZA0_9MICO|nr:phosphotransferase [Microbacterium telephonicum]RLK49104.1 aminoglycoside phosphotransferase (APT) family kinase protein [Microbacterium telephonicum]
MARSPLTLAAAVTSALPRTEVVRVAELTEGMSGRYDSAIATLGDGRQVVVRVAVDAEAADDLAGDARALAALSAGVRGVLPFAAPDVLGRATLKRSPALVQSFLPGYRVDAGHVPAGPGVATALADALAAVHALPTSVVRDAGLPVRTAAQVRDEAERLLDRAEATERLPFGLLRRWSTAIGTEALWRFETTVTLGGADPSSFLLSDDVHGIPRVSGLLSWSGLGVGDPAQDLRWLASAPAARDDVLAAYSARAHRATDTMLAERARLHAELEFAAWLVHGHDAGTASVVDDAVALLESLADSVRDEPPLGRETVSVSDAMAVLGRVSTGTDAVDTSMQTDTYDPERLGLFSTEEIEALNQTRTGVAAPGEATEPLEFSLWSGKDAEPASAADLDAEPDIDSAARNAMRRWTGTD